MKLALSPADGGIEGIEVANWIPGLRYTPPGMTLGRVHGSPPSIDLLSVLIDLSGKIRRFYRNRATPIYLFPQLSLRLKLEFQIRILAQGVTL